MGAYALVRELVHSLERAMILRANGSMHARNCDNSTVNSRWYACSAACIEDNNAVRAARVWLQANVPTLPRMRVPT